MARVLHQIVSESARRWPRRMAIIETGRQPSGVTYKELDTRINALCAYLLQKGLKKGDRVGVFSHNSVYFVTAYFAISKAGGVSIPFNYLAPPEEIEGQIADCKPSAVFIEKKLNEKISFFRRSWPGIKLYTKESRHIDKIINPPRLSEKDLASIIYTSGSTGLPMGVMLSNRNLISNNNSIMKYMKLRSSDRICCVLPFFYIYGLSLLLSHLMAGAAIIIDNRFMYPNVVLSGIEKYKATEFAGVSAHYSILANNSTFLSRRLSSVRYFIQAGDSMPIKLTRILTTVFPGKKVYLMYGQTEASPRLAYLNPALACAKPDSVGRAIPGVKIRVVNKSGRGCKPGEKGEIIAKGDNIMMGYWNKPAETHKTLKDNWLYTGDIAYRDREGDIRIIGRKKNFLKIGAHKVNPLEIEKLVSEDKKVLEAVAMGVKDHILGTRIRLFVSLVPGNKISSKGIFTLCRNRLPSYKRPSEIIVLARIPKNSLGKTDIKKLRAL